MFAIKEPEPYLYILMRSDLDSLNPGKMVAQGAHAANQFVHELEPAIAQVGDQGQNAPKVMQRHVALYRQWSSSTPQGFGVTITLDVTGAQLPIIVDAAKLYFAAGVTHDPSYPLLDGAVLHLLPLDTCGYVFGDKSKLEALLSHYKLLA